MSQTDDGKRAIASPATPLPLFDRAVLVTEILVAYGVVRWQLRRRALPAVLTLVRTGGSPAVGPRPLDTDADRLAAVVVRVLERLPSDARCLTRSLVVLAMLARRGIETRLVLAARPEPTFCAHAWVERDGRPLLPTRGFADARLTEL